MNFILYPILLFNFWFIEAPINLLGFYRKANVYFLNILSFPILLKTFFKPLKNEYRKGFVGFSVAMGMVIKLFLLTFDLAIFIVFLFLELLFLIIFLGFPVFLIYILFK